MKKDELWIKYGNILKYIISKITFIDSTKVKWV